MENFKHVNTNKNRFETKFPYYLRFNYGNKKWNFRNLVKLVILSTFPGYWLELQSINLSTFTLFPGYRFTTLYPWVTLDNEEVWQNDNLCESLEGSQVNLCPWDRLKALGIFLRQTLGLRPRVCLRKIPWAFNLSRGNRFTWLPSRLLHRLSQLFRGKCQWYIST